MCALFSEKKSKSTGKKGHSSFALDLADTRKSKVKRLTKVGGKKPDNKKDKSRKMKGGGKKGGGKQNTKR